MAGFVKIWTTIKYDKEFLSLRAHERGILLQLIITAKEQQDNGCIFYRNIQAFANDMGCNWRTADKSAAKLQRLYNWTYTRNDDGTVSFEIPNYKYYQELGVKELMSNRYKSAAKIQPLRPDQTRAEQTIPYRGVVEHLNLLTGKNYNHEREHSRRWIRARWNEGFRLDDFIYVNQIKAEEWLGTEREKYLRPETLYGTKMESYRQQRKISRQYSEKTNKALVAAALYLKNEGIEIASNRQTEISGGAVEAPVGLPEGH